MLSAAAESFVGKWWHGFVAWLCLKFLRAHRISFPYVSHHLMISLQNLQPSHWYPVHISLRDAGGWCAWWGCGRWGGSSCVNASHQSYSSSGHVELALLLVKEACQLVLGPWGRSIFRFHNYGRKRKSFLHLFQTWGKLSKVPRASPSWKMDWNMRQFFFLLFWSTASGVGGLLGPASRSGFSCVCHKMDQQKHRSQIPENQDSGFHRWRHQLSPSPENPKGDDVFIAPKTGGFSSPFLKRARLKASVLKIWS